MPKLREQKYKHADGSTHVNCYNLSITRKVAEMAGFNPADELAVRAENGRIIVERATDASQAG